MTLVFPVLDTADELVGLSESDAIARAGVQGWSVRVAQRNGEVLAVTEDFSETRVNVAVEGGKVSSILSIG